MDNNLTFEALLENIIAEYMQVTLVPGGKLERGPVKDSNGNECITLRALCHFNEGCPRNFSEFLVSVMENGQQGIGRREAFAWWARSRLRYSCSTIAVSLYKFVVPSLNSIGISQLRSVTLNKFIKLENFEIYSLGFIPKETQVIELTSACSHPRTEIVQPVLPYGGGYPPHCSHNFIKCKESGSIIDCALGQFLGTMKPYIFNDMDEFLHQIPGDVLYYFKTKQDEIEQQAERDSAKFRSRVSPDSIPSKFSQRVLRSCNEKKGYCWNCKGISTIGTDLKTCKRCNDAKYCSRDCQQLHWKSHKLVCNSTQH